MKNRLLQGFVTCAYTGYLPYAPGTWASLLGCALLYISPFPLQHPLVVAPLAVIAVLAINGLRLAERDPGYVTIDELVGMFVAMMGHQASFSNLLKSFILFRLFDILKPYPIRQAERLPRGYGIVADDIVAGAFASLALVLLGRLW